MSDNPFVNQLGDALEAAAERRLSRRTRRSRRLLSGVLVAVVLSTGVAVGTTILGDSERVAAGSLYCYGSAALKDASGIYRDARPPTVACAEELGLSGPLVACEQGDAVAVVPTTETCRQLGLRPLPAEFETARQRVLTLERDVRRLEAAQACIAPDQLARQVQALLDRTNWTGWNAKVRDDLSRGPCGHALWLNGDGSRSLSMLPGEHQILIAGEPN